MFRGLTSPLGALPKPQMLVEQVTEALEAAILSGSLKGGTQLVEAELQKHFGISRSPLREAFRELEKNGYVEISPRRGCFVKKVRGRDVEEVYFVRIPLEAFAARLALQNRTSALVEELAEELAAMEAAQDAQNTRVYLKHHDRYHDTYIAASDNSVLIEILRKLRAHSNWHRFYFHFDMLHFGSSLDSHRDIQRLMADPDTTGDQMESGVRQHIAAGCARFQQHLKENPDLVTE